MTIGPVFTTTQAQLRALETENCTAETLVGEIARIAHCAQALAPNAKTDTTVFVDTKFKVTLHSKTRHLEICDDCSHETWAPGLIKIENVSTGQAFSFDDVALHQMITHHNFKGERGWNSKLGFNGEVDIPQACKVLHE